MKTKNSIRIYIDPVMVLSVAGFDGVVWNFDAEKKNGIILVDLIYNNKH